MLGSLLTSPGRGKPYMMLAGISASAEAEPLQHTLHNRGWAQLQPDRVRPPQPRAVPACPTGLHTLPTVRVTARDMGKAVGSAEMSCYTSFPYLGFHQAPEQNWYKPLLFPHYCPSISYPTRSLGHAFSRANWLFVINVLIILLIFYHIHMLLGKKLAGGTEQKPPTYLYFNRTRK